MVVYVHIPASLKVPRSLCGVYSLTMWISSSPTELIKAVSTYTFAFAVLGTETSVVPIEETVRAFNFVIEKGWVRVSPMGSVPTWS